MSSIGSSPSDVPLNAERLHTLNEIGRAVTGTLDLQSLFETIYTQVSRVMDTTIFFIALHRPQSPTIDLPYMREKGTLFIDQHVPYGSSVTGLVIQRGTALHFDTVAEYMEYCREGGLADISLGNHDPEGMIFVPLSTGNRVIGVLSVQSSEPFIYTTDDVQILTVIASQAAVAITNASLYMQSQASVKQTEVLLAVARMITTSLDLQTVLDCILTGMREVVPYYLGAVLLPDHRNGWLDIVGSVGPLADERRTSIKIPFGTGITGKVFTEGHPILVNDVTRSAAFFSSDIQEIKAELAVPLKRGDTIVGVLDVERAHVDSFSGEDLDLMTLFASQAAIAIENARLFAAQESRIFELQMIGTIVQNLSPLHDVPDIAAIVLHDLHQLIEYDRCEILLLAQESGSLVPIPVSGASPDATHGRAHERAAAQIIERGMPLVLSGAGLAEQVIESSSSSTMHGSILGAPLIYESQPRGAIVLSHREVDRFDENSVRLLEIVAAQVAMAIDRARLYEELRTEAITDPLTKLHNRRYLFERFKEERSRARRSGHPLTVIMLDIDHFKEVNDAHGHIAGDVVLKVLADVIRGIVRAQDLVARYGGEEFCIVLPEISVHDAKTVANRLRLAVAACRLPEAAGISSITVSVGMAHLRPADEDGEVFSRADVAMYEVKHRGGNLVAIAEENATRFEPVSDG